MGTSSGFRIGAVALVTVIAVALGIVLLDGSSSDAAGRYHPPKVDQSEMVLRLTDLPPGFGNGYLGEGNWDDGLVCEAFSEPSAQHGAMVGFVRKYRPRGCIAAYDKRYEIPGEQSVAPVVFSGVLALGSPAAVQDAWGLVPTMLGGAVFGSPRKVKTSVEVGARTRLFHTARAWWPYLIRGKHKASLLAWRSGNTVAVVAAMGGSVATNDRFAAELARRQQAHILGPTPYTGAERFDGEVGLDDPAIDLPVYWLGRNFRPGHGLPDNRLFRSYYSGEPLPETDGEVAEKPYGPLSVAYENIWLDTWTPATWNVFADSRTGRAITSWKCTRARTIPLAEGTATIFAGYKENFGRCPNEKRKVFTAWVDLGEVRIVVNSPPAPDFIETVNPYGSLEGMEAIVRGLRLRPKPAY